MIVELDPLVEVTVVGNLIQCHYWIELNFDVLLATNVVENHEVRELLSEIEKCSINDKKCMILKQKKTKAVYHRGVTTISFK
jgi:hypothetical protein